MASAPAQHHAFHHLLQLSITRRACRDRRMLLKLLNLRRLLLRTLLRQLPEQLLQHLLNLSMLQLLLASACRAVDGRAPETLRRTCY